MTLKITLKPGQGFLIGGAHVEVVSKTICTILIDGDEPVLRAEYAIHPRDVVDTPSRLRLVLQKMYLSGTIADFHDEYFHLTQQFLKERPEAGGWVAKMNRALIEGDIYKAVKAAKRAAASEPLLDDEDPEEVEFKRVS